MATPDARATADGQHQDPARYPVALREPERKAFARRAGVSDGQVAPTTGVALSGGGIRSATLSLGFFQGLAASDLIRKIDVLSTVSGGGYFGAFLGALFVRAGAAGGSATMNAAPPDDYVRDVLRNRDSFEVDWLRNNGRYLAPNGSGDALLGAAVILRNWLAINIVLAVFFAALSLLTLLIRTAILQGPGWPILGASRLAWGVWWSPWLLVAALVGVLVVLPMDWAYWLGPLPLARASGDGATGRRALWWTWAVPVAVLVAGGFALPRVAAYPWLFRAAGVTFPAALSMAATIIPILTLGLGVVFSVLRPEPDRFANVTSLWFSRLLWLTIGLAVFALIDSLGETIAWYFREVGATRTAGLVGGGVLALIAVLQKLKPLLSGAAAQARRLGPALLFGALATVLAAVLLVAISAIAHAVAFDPGGRDQIGAARAAVFFGIALLISFLAGRAFIFVNQSSLHAMYAARLGRAYLGASNPNRRRSSNRRISDEVPDDEIALSDYSPETRGGPLHLINVTINETIDGQYQVEYRDRKGLPMAVSHVGVSVGARHHATWDWRTGHLKAAPGDGFHVWQRGQVSPEQLLVGRWAAISGAAVGTGLGMHTSLALSLLLGLANVRLGYWWDSGVKPRLRGTNTTPGRFGFQMETVVSWIFPAQIALVSELLGRFPGVARRRWNLSDGGHFDNSGAYELIRRRLPHVIVCDNGCDPNYRFDDVANLARRVRADFGAEITFLDRETFERQMGVPMPDGIGTLEELAAPTDWSVTANAGVHHVHAAAALVTYAEPPSEGEADRTVLLLVKPRLSGDEPVDLRQYKQEHADFPNQSTSEQFFNDAQWESYRKLGEHAAKTLFGDGAPTALAAQLFRGGQRAAAAYRPA